MGKFFYLSGFRRGVFIFFFIFRRVFRVVRERSSRLGGIKGVFSWVCSGFRFRKVVYRTREVCEGNVR